MTEYECSNTYAALLQEQETEENSVAVLWGWNLNFFFFWQEGPFNLLVMRIGALKKAGAYRGSGSLSISGFLGVQ